jgi:hypothetical protein
MTARRRIESATWLSRTGRRPAGRVGKFRCAAAAIALKPFFRLAYIRLARRCGGAARPGLSFNGRAVRVNRRM